ATIRNAPEQYRLREKEHPWNWDEITTRIGTGDPIAVVDQKTINQCRKTREELEFELETPVSEERRETILEEIEKINTYLVNSTFGGKPKTIRPDDRARVAVYKAIQTALDAIEQENPELAEHLRSEIDRGFDCCYRSDSVRWLP